MLNSLESISQKLQTIWKNVYIVGWWCRENIFWYKDYNWDVDLTTDASPDEVKSILKVINEVGKKYWTMIIKEWIYVYEITTFRSDIWILDNRKPVNVKFTSDLNIDSTRRDFTINAIYYDIKNEKYIDPQNWIEDIKNSKIKFVWNILDRINEDALRILRFIRIKNKYNLECSEKNYLEIIKNNISLLNNISIERIKDEFEKILLLDNNVKALQDLKTIWFFILFMPEIDNLEITPWWPSYHLEWNVWVHTMMTIEQLNKIFKEWFDSFDDNKKYYTDKHKIYLYWTMLLHDIAKYETYSIDDKWHVHYYNHENLWVEKAKEVLKLFIFWSKATKKILILIEKHLKIFKVLEMKKLKARKFMMEKYFEDLMIIWVSDHLWKIPADESHVYKLKKFYKDFLNILKDKKFYNWIDIMNIYPGIKWADIKNKLNEKNDEILLNDEK